MTQALARFNTLDEAFIRDPYPTYARLRESRLHWMTMGGGELFPAPPEDNAMPGIWILTRYDDCASFLRDERVSADPTKSQLFKVAMTMFMGGEDSPAIQLVKHLLLFMDPPDHTRLRSLANAAFSRRAVESLRPRIATLVDKLLGDARDRGDIDLVSDFAYPFPITVIAEVLGVPVSDRDMFGQWARDLVDLFGTEDMSSESAKRGNDAILGLNDYFTDLGNDRKAKPRDDLITAFVEVEEQGERLTHDEFLATCLILLIAGHETTANLIGLGTLNLLRRPDALQRLKDDPSIVSHAVEELLRLDSPVQATARTTIDAIEIDGKTIPATERVLVLIGSANHDPAKFEYPDRIVLDRTSNPFLSFGGGIHFCLGAPLARLEAREAFGRLVQLDLELASDDLEFRPTFPIRGLRSLPLSVH